MSNGPKSIALVCPRCKKIEYTFLDPVSEPPQAERIELACPKCLEQDDSLPIDPTFRDANGVVLFDLPPKRNQSEGFDLFD